VVLTAKSLPDGVAVASETVAVAPRPIMGPLVHSMDTKTERERERERGREHKEGRKMNV
jgi:hypothetical protein